MLVMEDHITNIKLRVLRSGVASWGDGGGPPRAARPGRHFLGGGKIEVIPKNKK